MIDRDTGKVSHAIVGYGGILGMGEDHFPVPWDAMRFDENKDGYVLPVAKDRLSNERAPRFMKNESPSWDRRYQDEVRSFYVS